MYQNKSCIQHATSRDKRIHKKIFNENRTHTTSQYQRWVITFPFSWSARKKYTIVEIKMWTVLNQNLILETMAHKCWHTNEAVLSLMRSESFSLNGLMLEKNALLKILRTTLKLVQKLEQFYSQDKKTIANCNTLKNILIFFLIILMERVISYKTCFYFLFSTFPNIYLSIFRKLCKLDERNTFINMIK